MELKNKLFCLSTFFESFSKFLYLKFSQNMHLSLRVTSVCVGFYITFGGLLLLLLLIGCLRGHLWFVILLNKYLKASLYEMSNSLTATFRLREVIKFF